MNTTILSRSKSERALPTTAAVYDAALSRVGARRSWLELPSGRRLHSFEVGTGPTVLHLHGTSTSGISHLPLLERLPHLRNVAVDRPGAGLTAGEPLHRPGYREAVVALLDEIVDAVDTGPVDLVGASMGGTWAVWYALARPARVRRIAMLGASPLFPDTCAPVPMRLSLTRPVAAVLSRLPVSRGAVARSLRPMGEGDTVGRHPEILDSLVAARRDPTLVAATHEEFTTVVSPFAPTGMRPSMRLGRDDLARLQAPTLFIVGDRDPICSVDAAREQVGAIPRARLEVLPSGHVPWLGHPDEVADLLATFLGEV